MAMLHQIDVSSRESALIGFASSLGRYPPRRSIPAWWLAFEAWYADVRAGGDRRDVMLRTEGFEYDEDTER